MTLKGKTTIVTGGTGFIGEAIVREFAAHGAHVIFTYHSDSSEAKAKALEKELTTTSAKVFGLQLNITSYENCESMILEVVNQYGYKTIDVLVNNAGINEDDLLMRTQPESYLSVINTNLTGTIHLTKIVSKKMMRQKFGSIINVSSVVGSRGNAGQSIYSSTKGAIETFTKCMAKELGARKIRFNCVAPGLINGGMSEEISSKTLEKAIDHTPLRRLGEPKEVANLVRFIAGDDASFITGQVISVCGGMNI